MKPARCKRCEALIVWARREQSDRFVPMNADPVSDGTHVLMGWDDPPVACRLDANSDAALLAIRDRYNVHACITARAS